MKPSEPDELISMRILMLRISVASRATVYKYIDQIPDFPQPCQFGVRRGRVRFKASDVNRYIASLSTKPKSTGQRV